MPYNCDEIPSPVVSGALVNCRRCGPVSVLQLIAFVVPLKLGATLLELSLLRPVEATVEAGVVWTVQP